jgi:CHRD domain
VATAADGGRPFSTALTGAAEVPGPGDANATGQSAITLNQGLNQICFDLSWADVDGTVFAAHIHVGAADEFGPVVVPLFVGQTFAGTGEASGCVEAEAQLIKDIRQDPSAFYVNVHSLPDFAAGAIRGQLGK